MTFKLAIMKHIKRTNKENIGGEGKGEVPHLLSYVAYLEECSEGSSALRQEGLAHRFDPLQLSQLKLLA